MKPQKPMLAASIKSIYDLKYPLLTSLKLDGIRALTTLDGPRTRSLKEIPNRHIRGELSKLPPYLDGELCLLNPDGSVNFRNTTSAVMSQDGTPSFCYMVFDFWYQPTSCFDDRSEQLQKLDLPDYCVKLQQHLLNNPDQVEEMFAQARLLDHEGLILRDPLAPYKHGRSTLHEQGMLKMKPWADAEAVIIDVVEEMFNANEATTSETGYTKRSSHQENKIPKGTMGALRVQSPLWGSTFEIGTGFTKQERANMWQSKPIGKQVKFKYIKAGGYDVPRHAVFLGFRHSSDT